MTTYLNLFKLKQHLPAAQICQECISSEAAQCVLRKPISCHKITAHYERGYGLQQHHDAEAH